MNFKKLIALLAILPMIAVATPVQPQQNIIDFSVSHERELPQDLYQISLFLREENTNLKKLNNSLNEKYAQAMKQIKSFDSVTIQRQQRDTQVNHNEEKGKVITWIGNIDIVLKSKNAQQLAELMENLSENFAVSNISASISPETLQAEEENMTREVVEKFKQKAELITQGFNAKRYEIIDFHLSEPEKQYEPRRYHMRADSTMLLSTAKLDSSALEQGEAKIYLRGNGRIQLIKQ